MIEVTFDHGRDFSRAARLFLRFFPRVFRKFTALAEEVLLETEQALKAAITDKDRSKFIKRLRAISPKWVSEKRRKGWKVHQLAATDAYANAIYTVTGKDQLALKLREGQYPGRDLSYSDIGRFLEYGTKFMKALPHWRKAAKYFRAELKRRAKEELGSVRVFR